MSGIAAILYAKAEHRSEHRQENYYLPSKHREFRVPFCIDLRSERTVLSYMGNARHYQIISTARTRLISTHTLYSTYSTNIVIKFWLNSQFFILFVGSVFVSRATRVSHFFIVLRLRGLRPILLLILASILSTILSTILSSISLNRLDYGKEYYCTHVLYM